MAQAWSVAEILRVAAEVVYSDGAQGAGGVHLERAPGGDAGGGEGDGRHQGGDGGEGRGVGGSVNSQQEPLRDGRLTY